MSLRDFLEKRNYRKKLKAFMEGLECQRIEEFIDGFTADDFKCFGKVITERTKTKINEANVRKVEKWN